MNIIIFRLHNHLLEMKNHTYLFHLHHTNHHIIIIKNKLFLCQYLEPFNFNTFNRIIKNFKNKSQKAIKFDVLVLSKCTYHISIGVKQYLGLIDRIGSANRTRTFTNCLIIFVFFCLKFGSVRFDRSIQHNSISSWLECIIFS